MLTIEQITGVQQQHLVTLVENGITHKLEKNTLQAYQSLKQHAREDGIVIAIASSYRDFDRQKSIWDNKASGRSVLLDSDTRVLDYAALSTQQLVESIMRWSALPGASRHHWGTDFDIYDSSALPEGYRLQLIPQEYASDGIFANLTQWLEKQWQAGNHRDFFRPYHHDLGGVAPEPWHLSYAPVSVLCETTLSINALGELLRQRPIVHGDYCLQHLTALFERFIINTDRASYHA